MDPKSPVTVDNFMGTIGTASKKLHGKIKNVICQLQWKILMFEPEAKYFLHQVSNCNLLFYIFLIYYLYIIIFILYILN